jgi:hypothetical protein
MHKSRFEKALTLSHVPRWAIVDTNRNQTVSDHTYRVCTIALELVNRINVTHTMMSIDVGRVLFIGIYHDIEEGITGDMPTPFKREMERLYNVQWPGVDAKEKNLEGSIINMADAIEAYTFLKRYSIVPDGRVAEGMRDHVNTAKDELHRYLCLAYDRQMPGMDQALMSSTLRNKLDDIVEDVVRVGTYYE